METITRNGFTVTIRSEEYDLEHFNPRQWDNLSTMVCWHPDYILGDFQITTEEGRGAIGGRPGKDTRFHRDDFKSMKHLHRYLGIVEKAVGIVPLYLYDHSGISMTAGSPNVFDSGGWDTTMCGFAYTTHARVTELCGDGAEYHTDEWIVNAVDGEVVTYNQYLTGDVWFYSIERDGNVIDSCGGFFGYEDAEREANEALDACIREYEARIAPARSLWSILSGAVAKVSA
jgi:hypothetical protein